MRVEFAIALFMLLIVVVSITFVCLAGEITRQKQDIEKLRGEMNIIRMDHCYMRQEFDIMRDVDITVNIHRSVSFSMTLLMVNEV